MKKNLHLFYVVLLALSFSLVKVQGTAQSSSNEIPYAGAKPSVVPDFGNVYLNANSDSKYFVLFGTNLISDLTVGPLPGYSFSVAPAGIYTPSVTVPQIDGKLNRNIYLRFSPDAVKAYNSSIPVSGGGAMSFGVAVSGSGIIHNTPNTPSLPSLSIELMASVENDVPSVDGLKVVFDNKYSAAIGDEDSYKFKNQDENIAIDRDGTMLSIEGRPMVTTNDTLPLRIFQLKQQQYYLKITGSDFSPLVTASLKDSYLNTETLLDLYATTMVPFTYDAASFIPNRFSLVLKAGGLLPVTITGIKAYPEGKGIKIDWNSQNEMNIDGYVVEKSIDGQRFENEDSIQTKGNNVLMQKYTSFDANVNPGNNFYRIRIIEKSGAVRYSQVVKVNLAKGNSNISIFPNPAKGNVIGLQISNLEKGKYTVSLYSNSGQNLYTSKIEHIGGSAFYSLSIVRSISKGIYSLYITKGETTINRLVMVQ